MLPSHSEIKAAVFALNKDSAPGPDGFGAFFYQHYWDIVKDDVINAVLEFSLLVGFFKVSTLISLSCCLNFPRPLLLSGIDRLLWRTSNLKSSQRYLLTG
jgi:hypothetical protein